MNIKAPGQLQLFQTQQESDSESTQRVEVLLLAESVEVLLLAESVEVLLLAGSVEVLLLAESVEVLLLAEFVEVLLLAESVEVLLVAESGEEEPELGLDTGEDWLGHLVTPHMVGVGAGLCGTGRRL